MWNGTNVTTDLNSQRWRDDSGNVTLDALGNWANSWINTDLTGSSAYTTSERDDRTHDLLNRMTDRTLKGQGPSGADLSLGTIAYDRASNLLKRPPRRLGAQ